MLNWILLNTAIISIGYRNGVLQEWLGKIDKLEGGMDTFSQGYKYYGLHFLPDNSVVAREWAPGARDVYLTGDFSK